MEKSWKNHYGFPPACIWRVWNAGEDLPTSVLSVLPLECPAWLILPFQAALAIFCLCWRRLGWTNLCVSSPEQSAWPSQVCPALLLLFGEGQERVNDTHTLLHPCSSRSVGLLFSFFCCSPFNWFYVFYRKGTLCFVGFLWGMWCITLQAVIIKYK